MLPIRSRFREATCLFVFLVCCSPLQAQRQDSFDAFTFTAPKGWSVEKTADSVVVKKDNGAQYANCYLFRARPSAGTHQADFAADWQKHAAKHGPKEPANVKSSTIGEWQISAGVGDARLNGQRFFVLVNTRTGNGVAYTLVHYFNDRSFADDVAQFSESVVWTGQSSTVERPSAAAEATLAGGMIMAKSTTNFDDGWTATIKSSFVQVTKAAVEVRLYHVNDAMDKGRPSTVDPADYYWARIAEPAFRVSRPQKWTGVTYPPIYFVQANAEDKRTGKPCYLALKVTYEGGARVTLVVSASESAFRQQFPQPNDVDRMRAYNRFAVTAADIAGTWVRNGGGGVEYYNAYSGNYAGMSANATTDQFAFQANGTYRSTHRYANTNNGATRFDGLDYQGQYTVSDWAVVASNRVSGKPKKFLARLEAIANGYLLVLTDSDYEPLQYVLFRTR